MRILFDECMPQPLRTSLLWLSLIVILTTPLFANLQQRVDRAVKESGVPADQIAITCAVLEPKAETASHRGNVQIYPASVVKLFYLDAVHAWLQEGKLKDTEELRRAMRDMIVDSGNEPTHYIVDLLTGTTSGPELPENELEEWMQKRNAVNRYFASQGFTNINVNRKPWCEGPYGREMQSIKVHQGQQRNMLTTDATAKLLIEILNGRPGSREMLKLLERQPGSKADSQANYIGAAVPVGTKLFSKAGWTSETRHDAAYLELPDKRKVVLVIFSVNQSENTKLIPSITRTILASE